MAICVLIGIAETKAQSGGAISAALSTRGDQTVLVSPDGAVWGLGRNINGSLGDGSTTRRAGLVRMQSTSGNLTGAVDVACGTNHTAVLMGNGTVWTTGLNSSGELGVDRCDGACGGGLPHFSAHLFRRGVGLGLKCLGPVRQQFDSEFDPSRQGSRFVRNRCDCGGRQVFLCHQE